jgi:hypothetical protein
VERAATNQEEEDLVIRLTVWVVSRRRPVVAVFNNVARAEAYRASLGAALVGAIRETLPPEPHRVDPVKYSIWYHYSFVAFRSQHEACRAAGISRMTGRAMHRAIRYQMTLG